jgi:glutathione S-transferase
MMILRSSPPSPFGRKVKITAKLLGLMDRIEIQAADPTNPNDSLHAQNPLGKIPVLVLDDGSCIYDSKVICEYLDSLSAGRKVIPSGAARWPVLRLASLADGVMEAALLLVYEKRVRPQDQWNAAWMANQSNKIDRALAHLEAAPPRLSSPPDIGQIGVACALGYLDLRHEGRWRAEHPRLVAWLDEFAHAVPAFEETRVKA